MFDNVWLLNLSRRPDRLASFWKGFNSCGWPFQKPQRFDALDGRLIPKPTWYTQPPGAWACLQSHLRMYELALNSGVESIFIFEDDCSFSPNSAAEFGVFFSNLPADWDQMYLGGFIRDCGKHPPEKINDHVVRLWASTGTWAIGMKAAYLSGFYQFAWNSVYDTGPMGKYCHIDQLFAEYQKMIRPNVYAPTKWIAGHMAGASDICNRVYSREHFFQWSYDGGVDLARQIGAIIDDVVIIPIASARIHNGVQVS